VLRGRIHAGPVLLGAFAVLLSACAHRAAARIPAAVKIGTTETGIASWYGVPYNGRPSASGEIYDMEKLTAAHRTLPFGTWVEVTDLENGKKVEVRVNDRGPFLHHRIIDLSLAAARQIEMVGPGTARVRLEVIAPPPAPAPKLIADPVKTSPPTISPLKMSEVYCVQAGAFSTVDRAESFAESLGSNLGEIRVEANRTVWRVLVGRAMRLEDAKQLAEKVHTAAGEGIVVADQ
jgi:rare lipoprotein A